MYPSMMNEEMIEEIKGIAAGAQEAGTDITWQEILAWNANEEIIDYWWPTVQKEVYGTLPDSDDKDHCSAFIAIGDATKDGELVIAHNSFSQFETGQFNNLILDIEPDQGYRIFIQSVPGYIHSMTDFLKQVLSLWVRKQPSAVLTNIKKAKRRNFTASGWQCNTRTILMIL